MAKEFKQIGFDPGKCRDELTELSGFLNSNTELSEKYDVQPFFRSREQLSVFLGSYSPRIGPATDIAFEYPIVGNFAADLIVGNKAAGEFCFIEFEDARRESVFRKTGRTISEWSPRFENGFSQIVDWFSLLDDLKKTDLFKRDFGKGHVRFSALLIIGRDHGINEYDKIRLEWRSNKVLLDSQAVLCVTFDRLLKDLDQRLKITTGR